MFFFNVPGQRFFFVHPVLDLVAETICFTQLISTRCSMGVAKVNAWPVIVDSKPLELFAVTGPFRTFTSLPSWPTCLDSVFCVNSTRAQQMTSGYVEETGGRVGQIAQVLKINCALPMG